MKVRIGIDVGGTFTDAALINNDTFELVSTAKVPTTHKDKAGVAAGVVAAFQNCLRENNIDPKDVIFVAHSTTQATNALIEGDVAKVGVVADGLKKMSKMVITSVSGATAGPGVSLALGGDFMICAEDAKFLLAFVNLGLVPDTGVTYLLSKAIGTSRTMELAATGRPMGAEEAKELGLAYKVVPVEELEEVTMKFAKKLAAGPLISYKNIKKQIYDANYSDYKKWLAETEIPTQRECAASMDFQEGCKAFMEKRKAIFEGK